jgi:hypothetical protein
MQVVCKNGYARNEQDEKGFVIFKNSTADTDAIKAS